MEVLKTIDINYADISESINISNERIYNLILLDVNFSGLSIPVVFDTGAMITVISKSVANLIGAQVMEESLRGGGNAGGTINANIAVIDCIHIGHSKIINKKVAILPDEALNFGVDDDGKQIIVNGFLGWDIIQHFKWTIDSRVNSIKIEKPIQSNLEINMNWDIMPLIYVNYGLESMCFGFDSGNTESVLGQQFIHVFKSAKGKIDTFTGVDGTVEEKVLIGDYIEFKIGRQVICLNNISVVNRDVFPAKLLKPMGLLAVDIIQNRAWSIDYFNRHFEIIE